MQLAVTFRHMEPSEALKGYVQERTGRLVKYIDKPLEAQVTLTVNKFRQIVDVVINANGIRIAGQESHDDMYAAVDLVMEKIERQVKKYREKIRRHKPTPGKELMWRRDTYELESFEDDREPVVVHTDSYFVKPMSIDEAAMQMELSHQDFLVFNNASTQMVNVLYRRKDGNYGLIVPQSS
ncbi:ribosome hibernation-promoting factor, HPF/YfiA family [Desulfomonile tiedjei]|uniref:Ribosome hibernation promoting factor n=1 Tax=Desulfomonile tiedjei (strain ATCC 49306 / DSM 6799 / DCB-1) TaxID=706587 RepID=I4CEX7_DESTA|nr:ribosome-associated translation inhibitor RaiA [Desulfomonile tiedjei]AFM28118.1 ribosomal subunit interface protein [Desulfomonile tiedjei DSM 6799]